MPLPGIFRWLMEKLVVFVQRLHQHLALVISANPFKSQMKTLPEGNSL